MASFSSSVNGMLAQASDVMPTKLPVMPSNASDLAVNPRGINGIVKDAIPSRTAAPISESARSIDTAALMESIGLRQFQQTRVLRLPDMPSSDAEVNSAGRVSRIVERFSMPRIGKQNKPNTTDRITLPYASPYSMVFTFDKTRVSHENLTVPFYRDRMLQSPLHGMDHVRDISSAKTTKRPRAVDDIINQRTFVERNNFSLVQSQAQRMLSRSVYRSIEQLNYALAYEEGVAYTEALAAGPGDQKYKDFFNAVRDHRVPRSVFYATEAFDGVLFENSEAADFDYVSPSGRANSMKTTSIWEGQTQMYNYTAGAGVIEGASVNLVFRRFEVTRDTEYFFAYDPSSKYGEEEGRYQTHRLDDVIPPGKKIYPLQMAILCWPDGCMPPADYRIYTSYKLSDEDGSQPMIHYDGMVKPVARILHRDVGRANGTFDYDRPPEPEALRPITDMRNIMSRAPITIIIAQDWRD